MKKLLNLTLSLLLLIPGQAFAGTQNSGQICFGADYPVPEAGVQTVAMSSATTYTTFGFTTNAAETLSKAKIYYGGTTGTPTAAGSTAGIHPDASGDPNATATETMQLAGAPSGAGVQEWTGFTTALTANTRYWIVFKNATATPASNYQTMQYAKVAQGDSANGGSANSGFSFKYTTDGTTWSSGGNNPLPANGIRLEFASGRFLGLLFTAAAVETSSTTYAARATGVKFTTPSTWPKLNVATGMMHIAYAGTKPASGLIYKIYSGTNPAIGSPDCTSATMPSTGISASGQWIRINFASNCQLLPNTIYRLVAAVANGTDGSAGNDYRNYKYTIDNTAGSKAQLPFGGVAFTYYNGSWADTDTAVLPFKLCLDTAGEFTVDAAGTPTARSLISGDID